MNQGCTVLTCIPPYTPAGIASLANWFHDIEGLTPEMRSTAAYTIIHTGKSLINPTMTTKNGGLDTMYIDLHGKGEYIGREATEIQEFLNKTQGNLLAPPC